MTRNRFFIQIDKFVKMMRMEHREGRAVLAPNFNNIINNDHCKRFNSAAKRVTKLVRIVEGENHHNSDKPQI